MQESIAQIDKLFGKQPIRIGAQCYLIAFYKSFGFVPEGEVTDEIREDFARLGWHPSPWPKD